MPYQPIYLWEITVNKSFTVVTHPAGTPAHGRPTVAVPTGRQVPLGRSPAVGTYEGWVTPYGVCGHILDSLSARGHSVTLWKPEQAYFGQSYVIMFFRQDLLKSEGRNNAHPGINTRLEGSWGRRRVLLSRMAARHCRLMLRLVQHLRLCVWTPQTRAELHRSK